MRLVFVHGIAQGGKNVDELKKLWMSTLNAGLSAAGESIPSDVKVDFPYYGNVLDQYVANFGVSSDEVATKKGVGSGDEFSRFAKELALEAKDRAGISDEEVKAQLGSEHGASAVTGKGPQNWEWVQAIVRIIDGRYPNVAVGLFSQFLREVYIYTRQRTAQAVIDKVVADCLTSEPTVVVGHSLGSVVAYNVLKQRSIENCRAYITLGSPLGIRAIKETIAPPFTHVSSGGLWYNGFDPKDIVALYPLDAQNFPLKVPPNRHIDNDRSILNTTENHHGIVSYLDKAQVAKAIAQAMRAQ